MINTKQYSFAAKLTQMAFSLIELLVVISTISLLISIIVPALGRAKAQAKLIVCQSQLRQWGFAFETYAADNNGYYPHIDGLDYGDGGADNFGWVDMLPPLLGKKRWRDYPIWKRPRKGIYQCPMAKLAPKEAYQGPGGYNPERNGYFSYAMNCCLELDSSCWPPYGATTWTPMPSFLDTAKIKQPARVILLFDQLLDPAKGYGGQTNNPSAGKHCGGYPREFSERHFKKRRELGGSILYCDHHVEWIETVWKPQWPVNDPNFQAPPRNDYDWYPY